MSKIGKLPIEIVNGVTVTIEEQKVTVTGSKGTLSYTAPKGITVAIEDNKVIVGQEKGKENQTKALFGLTRALLANLVKGVSTGFEKKLELAGVGFRAQTTGAELTLSVGFYHPVKIKAPTGITFAVVDNNKIVVSGSDKALVGNTAAVIRAVRAPEPYKGKGIKYEGEKIRRKAGKSAKAVGAK